MITKTIALAGSEERAEFSGANAWLRNDGADVIYAAAKPGITAGADGVVAIPAGQSAPVYGANGAVWLLGTGSVQLIGSDYSTNPFKTSAQAGGSGADDVARAAISAHSGNAEIHVTAEEKAHWTGKSDFSGDYNDLNNKPESLPANAGNADTVGNKSANAFMQFIKDLRSGSLLDYIAGISVSGYMYCGGANVSDMPVDNTYFMVQVRCYTTVKEVIATRFNTGEVYINHYSGTAWFGWHRMADGGNAASVGTYTEAKIAALEARIAALEGN